MSVTRQIAVLATSDKQWERWADSQPALARRNRSIAAGEGWEAFRVVGDAGVVSWSITEIVVLYGYPLDNKTLRAIKKIYASMVP